MRLVLVGPPGSGKGTQAKKLVEREKLIYIGTGEILRDAIRRRTPLGVEIEPLLKRGLLVEDTIVNDVIAELFRSPVRPESFVLDGYPRTLAQAVSFDALMRQQFFNLDAVVNLTIEDDLVVERISGRRCCSNPECGFCYHLLASPPKKPDICDKCGSSLFLRDDDREETVRRRLVEFHKNTDSLLDHYNRQGILRNVSALDPVETIYANVVKAITQSA
jgi:adenylate kinase